MQLSTVKCTIWEKLKVPFSNSYKIYFKGEPMLVDGNMVVFIVENKRNFFSELDKIAYMSQFSKIIIENHE